MNIFDYQINKNLMIPIPVMMLDQTLPYNSLANWKDFERLIVQLVSKKGKVEQVESYRKPGAKQEGIDIFCVEKLNENPVVYQCKKYEWIIPSDIKKAVDEFLKGKFKDIAKRFVFCVSSKMDTEELFKAKNEQRERLNLLGIEFQTWEPENLDIELFSQPEIVYRFFGINWVQVFNGHEAFLRIKDNPEIAVKQFHPSQSFYMLRELQVSLNDFTSNAFFREAKGTEITLQKLIEENTMESSRIILMSSAGAGKSQELKHLAHCFSLETSTYWPVLLSLKNYTGENIDDFIGQSVKNWKAYPEDKTALLLDSLDEVEEPLYRTCISKINQFAGKYKKINIVVTARSISYASSNEPSNEELSGFHAYYLAAPSYINVNTYLQRRLQVDFPVFFNLLHRNSLDEWLRLPFFLNLLVEKFLEDGPENFPLKKSDVIEWFIGNRIRVNKTKYKFSQRVWSIVQKQITTDASVIAYAMTMLGQNKINDEQLTEILPDETSVYNLRYSEVITASGNIDNAYFFEHNNFKEFLSAKVLLKLNFYEIKRVITYSPSHQRIQPKWSNVLSFFFGLAQPGGQVLNELSEWMFNSQPEMLLEMEADKIGLEMRLTVCKKIILKKKQKTVYIHDENLRLEKIISFSGETDEMVEFLTNELLQNKTQHYEPYRHDIIYMFSLIGNLHSSRFAVPIREELIGIVLDNMNKSYIVKEALECLSENKLLDVQQFDKIITRCPLTQNRHVREGFYELINSLQLSNQYVQFLIDGIAITDIAKNKNRNEIVEIGWAHKKAFKGVSGAASLKTLLIFIDNNIHIIDQRKHDKLQLPQDLLGAIFLNAAAVTPVNDDINKLFYSILEKLSKEYIQFNAVPFRDYLATTGQSRMAVLKYARFNSELSSRNFFYVNFLFAEDFEWLCELYKKEELSQETLLGIIHWLRFYNLTGIARDFANAFREKFPEHAFSNRSIEVNLKELDENQDKMNQYLLSKQDKFLLEGERIFSEIGKEEINFLDVADYEFDEGNRRLDLTNTIIINYLRNMTAGSEGYKLDNFRQFFSDTKNWADFVFDQTIDLIQGKKKIYEPMLIEKVKSWFYLKIDSINFQKSRWMQDGQQWHYQFAGLLIYIMQALSLPVKEDKLLEMLAYDNAGLYDYPAGADVQRLSDYALEKYPDKEKFIQHVISNIREGNLVHDVVLTHIRLAKLLKIKPLAPDILLMLTDDRYSDTEKAVLIEIYSALGGAVKQLEELVLAAPIPTEWINSAIGLLVASKSKRIEVYLEEAVENLEITLKNRLFIAKQLAKLKNQKGLATIFSFLIDTSDIGDLDYKTNEVAESLSCLPNEVLPFLKNFLIDHYSRDIESGRFFDRPIDLVFDIAQKIAIQSYHLLELVISMLNEIADLLKENYPNARYLYTKAISIEKSYYLNRPDNKPIDVVKAEIEKLRKLL